MRLTDFGPSKPGKLVRLPPDHWAFVPAPLAPKLSVGSDIIAKLSRAERALGYLSGLFGALENGQVLAGLFVKREAVHASRLEGQSALPLLDLFLAEERGEMGTAALQFALHYGEAFRSARHLGVSLGVDRRLLRGLHRRVADELGSAAGDFRTRQTWVGPPGCTAADAVYVPPPVDEMHSALAALEEYGRTPDRLPPMLRLGLMHYQLHAIQPFAHRSGAVNRLLLGLMLTEGPDWPPVPIGLAKYLADHRDEYARRLLAVTLSGQWEAWFRFLLEGVATQAEDAARRTGALLGLMEDFRKRVQRVQGRQPSYRLIDAVVQRPVIAIDRAARVLATSLGEAEVELERLRGLGILAPHRTQPGTYYAPEIVTTLEGDIQSVSPAIQSIMAAAAELPAAVGRRHVAGDDLPDIEENGEPWTRVLVSEAERVTILNLLREIEEAAALAA